MTYLEEMQLESQSLITTPKGMTVLEWHEHPVMVLKGMNEELRSKYERILAWHKKDGLHRIFDRYDLGVELQEVVDQEEDEAGTSRYGSKAMEKLVKVLPWSKSLLYEALRFARVYTREEAKNLATVQMGSGYFLTWSHVVSLTRLPDDKERDLMLARVLRENLDCGALDLIVQQLRGEVQHRKPGIPTPPRHFDGLLAQQGTYAAKTLDRKPAWSGEHSLMNRYMGLPLSSRNGELTPRLKEHAEKCRKVAEEWAGIAQEAEEVYQRHLAILSNLKARSTLDPEEANSWEVEEVVEAEDRSLVGSEAGS